MSHRIVFFVSLALGLVGCKKTLDDGFAVDFVITTSPALSAAVVSSIHTIEIAVSGDETYTMTFTPPKPFSNHGEERAIYHPLPTSQHLSVAIIASDGAKPVAYASLPVTLIHGATVLEHVVLTGDIPPPDLGLSLDGGTDMAGEIDLSSDIASSDSALTVDDLTLLLDLTPAPDMAQPIVSFDVVASPALVNEHQSFNVHLTARTNGAAILTTYSGGVSLSADWGDVRVITPPVFVNGQADATVALNRETNPTNGLVHVLATDAAATGTSQGITVSAPAWTSLGASAVFVRGTAGAFDEGTIKYPSWLLFNGQYYMFYMGTPSGSPSAFAIGRALSSDGITWSRSTTAVLSASASGWDNTENASCASVQADGNTLVMTYLARGTATGQGFATSPDGIAWTRNAAVNVAIGAAQTECNQLEDGPIWVDSPGHYLVLAHSYPKTAPCRLYSGDSGGTWPVNSVYPLSNVPVTGGGVLKQLALVKDGSVYRLWYDSGSGSNYATSTDGINWINSPSNPQSIAPWTVLWNQTANRYEGMVDPGDGTSGFTRAARP